MLQALSQQFLQWEDFFQRLGLLGVVAFAILIVGLQLFCLPLSPFGIMAGLFFGLGNGFLAVTLGTYLGAVINFILSRHFIRERVARWLNHHEKFRLIDTAIARGGWKVVALLRFCPIPFGLANYSYGLTAVGFTPYYLATIFAIIPGNLFFVWFGATSQDALAVISGNLRATPGQTVFAVVGLVAFFVLLTYVGRLAHHTVTRDNQK